MTGENYLLVNQYDSIVAKSSDINILKLALCQKERIRIVKGEEGWENYILKPYLIPQNKISSLITAKELSRLSGYQLIDWYNANHIDYKGLIEKGLALEATTNMYNN